MKGSQEIKNMVEAARKVVLAAEVLKRAEREHSRMVEDHIRKIVVDVVR